MEKVGQNPLDPKSSLVLCACCGIRTARIYERFPGLCEVCSKVANGCCTSEATLDFEKVHGFLSTLRGDMEVLVHIFNETGFKEAAGAVSQAIELLKKAYEKILEQLDSQEQAFLTAQKEQVESF